MFIGEYRHTIDEKGRMTIPAAFRDLLDGETVITLAFQECLTVWPAPAYEQLRLHISSLSITDPKAQLLRHMFLTKAAKVEFDKAGRILLPQHLRDAIHLESNAIVAGGDSTFAIWTPEEYAVQNQRLEEARKHPEIFESYNLPLR